MPLAAYRMWIFDRGTKVTFGSTPETQFYLCFKGTWTAMWRVLLGLENCLNVKNCQRHLASTYHLRLLTGRPGQFSPMSKSKDTTSCSAHMAKTNAHASWFKPCPFLRDVAWSPPPIFVFQVAVRDAKSFSSSYWYFKNDGDGCVSIHSYYSLRNATAQPRIIHSFCVIQSLRSPPKARYLRQ